jgi:hypothetical protein
MRIPIPDDWDGVSWCCYLVEWPESESWKAILNGQVTAPSKGRFWDERTGTITDVQEIGLEIFERNLLGGNMACFDELAASIEYLADKLAARECCGGGIVQVTGSGTGGSAPTDPDATTEEDDGSTPPTGFDTYSEYLEYKCAVATWILDFWAKDVSNAALVNWVAGLTLPEIIALLVATLLTPIPGDEVVVLAGAIVYLVTQGIIDPVLSMIGAELAAQEDDLLCALYEAADVNEARDNVRTVLEDAFSASYSAVYAAGGALLIGSWLRNDNLNRLFDQDESFDYPAGDCSGCGSGICLDDLADMIDPTALLGTITDISAVSADEVTVTIESEYLVGEDHERTGVSLKSSYISAGCSVYSNGMTYDSGPGSEANLDMAWELAGGGFTTDSNPDGIHRGDKFQWIQAGSISPGQFTMTVTFVRDDPS